MSKGPEERTEKNNGVGALGGMMLGGVIGLVFGAPGVLICGVIGGLAGNAIENADVKQREEQKRRVMESGSRSR